MLKKFLPMFTMWEMTEFRVLAPYLLDSPYVTIWGYVWPPFCFPYGRTTCVVAVTSTLVLYFFGFAFFIFNFLLMACRIIKVKGKSLFIEGRTHGISTTCAKAVPANPRWKPFFISPFILRQIGRLKRDMELHCRIPRILQIAVFTGCFPFFNNFYSFASYSNTTVVSNLNEYRVIYKSLKDYYAISKRWKYKIDIF